MIHIHYYYFYLKRDFLSVIINEISTEKHCVIGWNQGLFDGIEYLSSREIHLYL